MRTVDSAVRQMLENVESVVGTTYGVAALFAMVPPARTRSKLRKLSLLFISSVAPAPTVNAPPAPSTPVSPFPPTVNTPLETAVPPVYVWPVFAAKNSPAPVLTSSRLPESVTSSLVYSAPSPTSKNRLPPEPAAEESVTVNATVESRIAAGSVKSCPARSIVTPSIGVKSRPAGNV